MKKLKSIKGIPLSYIRSILKIDSKSLSGLTWLPRIKTHWNTRYANKSAGYKRYNHKKNGYYFWELGIKYNGKVYKLFCSEIVFLVHNGYLTDCNTVSHKDGNTLNNKIKNIIELTPFEKGCYFKIKKNNATLSKSKKTKYIKDIPLSYIQSVLKIDSKSLSGLTWLPRNDIQFKCGNKSAGHISTLHKDGYESWIVKVSYKGKGCNLLCSRVILLLKNKYLTENKFADHKDGNPMNNKVNNLRESTPSQNCMNRKIQKNSISGHPGVCWHKLTQKWQVRIRCNCKTYYFGLYKNKKDAIKVAIEATNKLHGEFSRGNRWKK